MAGLNPVMPVWFLTDIRRLVVTFAVALASGWGFLQIGIPAPYLMGSLFGVWIGRFNALEPRLPLRRRHAAEGIVEQPNVALAVLGQPMLAGGSVHGVVEHDMSRAVGWGLAASGKRTSIKRAEQRLPG